MILGLVAAIVFALVRAAGDADDEPAAGGNVVTPANVTADDAIPVGQADAPVTVEIYYDYMCPACGAFEKANAAELDKLIEAGTVKIELRPMAFLDEQSNGTKYSTRSANAIATVTDGALDKVWDFHTALYAQQPREGSDGLSDDTIAQIATTSGVPSAVVDRFGDRTYDGWVGKSTQAAFDAGVKGTPTVLIDGKVFEGDLFTAGPLTDAIEKAAQE